MSLMLHRLKTKLYPHPEEPQLKHRILVLRSIFQRSIQGIAIAAYWASGAEQKRNLAATKIAARVRGNSVRAQQRKRQLATTVIVLAFRMKLKRKVAATKIAAVMRGNASRAQQRSMDLAATKIAAAVRGRQAKRATWKLSLIHI